MRNLLTKDDQPFLSFSEVCTSILRVSSVKESFFFLAKCHRMFHLSIIESPDSVTTMSCFIFSPLDSGEFPVITARGKTRVHTDQGKVHKTERQNNRTLHLVILMCMCVRNVFTRFYNPMYSYCGNPLRMFSPFPLLLLHKGRKKGSHLKTCCCCFFCLQIIRSERGRPENDCKDYQTTNLIRMLSHFIHKILLLKSGQLLGRVPPPPPPPPPEVLLPL